MSKDREVVTLVVRGHAYQIQTEYPATDWVGERKDMWRVEAGPVFLTAMRGTPTELHETWREAVEAGFRMIVDGL